MSNTRRRTTIFAAMVIMMMVAVFLAGSVAAEAAGKQEVYTSMTGSITSSAGDGTKTNPYNRFEDAVANVADGGTIYILKSGHALLNTQDEAGHVPYVINKDVTIMPEDGTGVATLDVRAAGIILGGDVTFQNIRLDFGSKYHDAIFANGHKLTLINVSRTSGARDIDLFAGGLHTNVTGFTNPSAGDKGIITVEVNGAYADTCPADLGNIYGGSMNGEFTGSAEIHLIAKDSNKKLSTGDIYACGAVEAEAGNMFDLTEPDPPSPSADCKTTGNVSVNLDEQTVKYINGITGSSGKTSLAVSTQYLWKNIYLENIDSITVHKGTFAPQYDPQIVGNVENGVAFSALSIAKGAELDLSSGDSWEVKDFTGGGALTLSQQGQLHITGALTGTTAFQTEGAFGGASGIAESDRTYIISNSEGTSTSFTFEPHSAQEGYTLEFAEENPKTWSVRESEDSKPVLESFVFENNVQSTAYETMNNAYYDVQYKAQASFLGNSEQSRIYKIPFTYTVRKAGTDQQYEMAAPKASYGYLPAIIPELGMRLEVAAYDDYSALIVKKPSWQEASGVAGLAEKIDAGTYEITLTYPTANAEQESQTFLLMVEPENDGTAPELAETNLSIQADSGIEYGKELTITAEVRKAELAEGGGTSAAVSEGSLHFYTNGKEVDASKVTISDNTGMVALAATEENGFQIGEENNILVLYDGSDELKGCVQTAKVTVNKMTPDITGSGNVAATYDGQAHPYTSGVTVRGVPDSLIQEIKSNVQILYKSEVQDAAVETPPVLAGTYDVIASVPEGSLYAAVESTIGQVVISKADAAITLSGNVTDDGSIVANAAISGPEGGAAPVGTVEFYLNDSITPSGTVQVAYGEATYSFAAPGVGTHKVRAKYISEGPHNDSESTVVEFVVPEKTVEPEQPVDPKPEEPVVDPTEENIKRLFGNKPQARIFGRSRYDTSIAAAENLKKSKKIAAFDNIIIACGDDFPDALSGSYLAKEKNAPVILMNRATEGSVRNYVVKNLKKGGTLYILGGTGVVSKSFENTLSKSCIVRRLAGNDRYATNMAILNEVSAKGKELLICSAGGYADSLSASATGKPVMIVGNSLTIQQKNYIKSMNPSRIYIVGGTGAVSRNVENSLRNYPLTRFAGINRYETSAMVAKAFFGKNCEAMVLAYGLDFPDGLSGGPLAMSIEGPLVLTASNNAALQYARSYAKTAGVKKAAVLGGPTLITDGTVNNILK